MMNTRERTPRIIRHTALAAVLLSAGYVLGSVGGSPARTAAPAARPVLVRALPLSEWEKLQMAIIMVESGFDPSAVGSAGDAGMFQITPVYVAECNRILGTKRFAPEDAFSPAASVEMFGIMQGHHNPERRFDRAVRCHNPGGRAIGYPRRVADALSFIRRYERCRLFVSDGSGDTTRQ